MVITQIKTDWFILTSDDGVQKLTWFGRSRPEVVAKFRSYVRNMDIEKIRSNPMSRGGAYVRQQVR